MVAGELTRASRYNSEAYQGVSGNLIRVLKNFRWIERTPLMSLEMPLQIVQVVEPTEIARISLEPFENHLKILECS